MLDEVTKSIRAQLYERTVSPLAGSFIISWLVINYRFVMLLLSERTYDAKIAFIDIHLYPSWIEVLGFGVVAPFVASLFYIYIYPYPAKEVYRFSRERQKEMADLKREIEGGRLLTRAEASALREELDSQHISFEKELSVRDEKIKLQNERIESLLKNQQVEYKDLSGSSRDNAESMKPYENEESDYGDVEIDLLTNIGREVSGVNEIEYLTRVSKNSLWDKHYIDELTDDGYIERGTTGQLKLSRKGRSYLVNSGFS